MGKRIGQIWSTTYWKAIRMPKYGTTSDKKGIGKEKIHPQRVNKPTNKEILVKLFSDWSRGPFCNGQVIR